MKKINKHSKNNKPSMENGHYKIESVSIKEIMDKYPDKVVGAENRKNESVLILDTCKIIFRKGK